VSNVLHIAGRELRMYVASPWTYVVLAAAVALLGFFFGGQVAWFAELCQRPDGGTPTWSTPSSGSPASS
jgi:hypothetical protein